MEDGVDIALKQVPNPPKQNDRPWLEELKIIFPSRRIANSSVKKRIHDFFDSPKSSKFVSKFG